MRKQRRAQSRRRKRQGRYRSPRRSESLVPLVVRDAQTLLAWLHGRHMTTVTAANLHKSGPRPLRFKARLDPAINVLAEHGWLIPTDASGRAWSVEGNAP